MNEQLSIIKAWLGAGSINIFGLPMAGKDTQGVRLAELLGAKFLSSGDIIRTKEAEQRLNYSHSGNLIPTDVFYSWVLPYFGDTSLAGSPLVLSSIGRWSGEENEVISALAGADHPLKAAILLQVSEADVLARFETVQILGDRGGRPDDNNVEVFRNRLAEFQEKTTPVLEHYRELGYLITVRADQPRDAVTAELVRALSAFALQNPTE